MGCIYPRGSKLWVQYKGADGKWRQSTTPFRPGQEKEARKLLREVENRIAAGQQWGANVAGVLTVAGFAERWCEERRKLGIADFKNEKARLKNHVLPAIGSMPLEDVRPRHIVTMVRHLRDVSRAPKTVRNVYGTLSALYRDAVLEDLVETSPCVLTKYQLGTNEDANPEWRPTAVYDRGELELLISDPRVPRDRQIFYALQGIGALRHGEAAGLRFRHWDTSLKPLSALLVATSYDKGRTKTGRARRMPVHPTLAAVLSEWKLHGWAEMMGRVPGPDDLVVPLPASLRVELGAMRKPDLSWRRLVVDLENLGLRHRRGHDLRRTMISLARIDGARADILRLCTHGASREIIDVYTTFPWESLCAEVSKLKLDRRGKSNVVVLPMAASATMNSRKRVGVDDQDEGINQVEGAAKSAEAGEDESIYYSPYYTQKRNLKNSKG